MALERTQQLSAVAAVVEELAGIGRHGLERLAATLRAGQCGVKLGHALPNSLISGASKYEDHNADKAMNAVAADSITKVAREGATVQFAFPTQARRLRM